jgi:GT2 family glycosyltransferase
MQNQQISVSIVTPVHNRKKLTLQCLNSIKKLNIEGLKIDVTVVDDGSTDGTSEAIRESFPQVEIINGDGNLWFTEGTNVGIRSAIKRKPKYILLINDDQIFEEKCLRYMVETAEMYPQTIVGSLLLLWDTPHKLFQVSPIWDTFAGGWRHWHHQTVWTIPDKPWEVGIIVGNCLLVPTKAFLDFGLMDSKRFPNFGDAELTPRMKRKGYTLLIEPRARVFCQPNNLPKRVSKMTLSQKFDALFINLGHIHNLRRRFYATMAGSPNFLNGIISFIVFFINLALGKNSEGKYAETLSEKPLSETFANNTVKR